MNFKMVGSILFVVSLSLIFGGSSIDFFNTFKEDREETRKINQEVNKNYTEVTNEMKELHQSMLEMQNLFTLYYENVGENKEYYQNQLTSIKKQKDRLEKVMEDVNESCQMTVNDRSKEKCKSMIENNQKAQDNYTRLEENYEQFMKGHEEWLSKNKTIAMK